MAVWFGILLILIFSGIAQGEMATLLVLSLLWSVYHFVILSKEDYTDRRKRKLRNRIPSNVGNTMLTSV